MTAEDYGLLTNLERERFARAESLLRRTNKNYKPLPKFRGGCKNC